MRRVFPRGRIQLLCQRCMQEGKEIPAGVQDATVALCWACYKKQQEEKLNYKRELGRKFNACLANVIITDNDEDIEWEEYEEDDASFD